jgi:hypothetical protein
MSQQESWRNANEEAMINIDRMLKLTDEWDNEFVKLANAITNTDKNPWSFMPARWESSKSCAQSYEMFLHSLHHAMCDDGDVTFIKITRYNDILILFIDRWEKELINSYIDKSYSSSGSNLEWEIVDVEDIIQSLK